MLVQSCPTVIRLLFTVPNRQGCVIDAESAGADEICFEDDKL